MEKLLIEGGRSLYGSVRVQGAKNSVLPILAATILCADTCVIENCPRLRDVEASVAILRHLGCKTAWNGDSLTVDTSTMVCSMVPDGLMRAMRSSVIFLGAILARCKEVELSYPGGCELGPRPIDLHLKALRDLGAEISEQGGTLTCTAQHLHAGEITLLTPSVGATENAILTACTCDGVSVIYNAAREPEIVDLAHFLNTMGAEIQGAGSSILTVCGKKTLHGGCYRVMSDRIVASTYLCAAAGTGGEIALHDVDTAALKTVTAALQEAGCTVFSEERRIILKSSGALHAIHAIHTAPYPGFPTDAQPVLLASLLKSRGSTVLVENIFENRFRYVDELSRMGAQIRVAGRVAVVTGTDRLYGAKVQCTDLRGGAALAIAGLMAEGVTQITSVSHIDRGYADLQKDITDLGGMIVRADDTKGRKTTWQDSAEMHIGAEGED